MAMEADDNSNNDVDNSFESRGVEEAMEADISDNSPAVAKETSQAGKTEQPSKPFVFSYR